MFRIALFFCLIISLSFPVFGDDLWGGDEFDEDFGGESEEYEQTMKTKTDSLLDLLDENREAKLKPEDYIFPFDPVHKPMLSSQLIASVGEKAEGFQSKRITKAKKKFDPKNPKASLAGAIGGPNFGGTAGGSVLKSGKGGKKGKKKPDKVVLPEFEISGKFGSKDTSYVVIGNRFYTFGERLKGSRDLRRVTVEGIEEQFAYFRYKDVTFAKKIKATELVFPPGL